MPHPAPDRAEVAVVGAGPPGPATPSPPRKGTDMPHPAPDRAEVAVVGAGPAGLAAAVTAA
ncbi:FAD/NAD(P)-binding oxidoreductase, partial [Streptomyces sp. SID9727]|nr:FAD/NAD(P)-binding oxidoreductase [Streptomyces sp. SID9727]